MRVWAGYCSVPISGMLIDTLAYQFIETTNIEENLSCITIFSRAISSTFCQSKIRHRRYGELLAAVPMSAEKVLSSIKLGVPTCAR